MLMFKYHHVQPKKDEQWRYFHNVALEPENNIWELKKNNIYIYLILFISIQIIIFIFQD